MPDVNLLFWVYLFFAAIWVFQFAMLMTLDDKSFPGGFDKLIWAAAFLLVFPVTPFAFMLWKNMYKSYIQAKRRASGN